MRRWLHRLARLTCILLAAPACNQAQPPVNRVQPNVVDKDSLENGEWYFLQTVIDTPYSSTYTFVGEQGALEKIVWEVQRDVLIARRSYQHIAESEPDGLAGDTEEGAPVAMYRIEKHFDIRREYNPTTGEELNVIVENATDLPWYERPYMRVDWSQNLITNNDFLTLGKIFDGIEVEPVAYHIERGSGHPHQPKFVTRPMEGAANDSAADEASEDGDDPSRELYYMDIVNKMFVRPTNVHIDGFGDVPSCFLLSEGHLDCAPGELTVRNSFLKVDARRGYQPMRYTGDRMERFGYFVTERAGYDDHYGVVEPARFRFVNRHDLWAQSYQQDDSGQPIPCTESNAAMVCGEGGAQCDTNLGRVRRERTPEGEWIGACTVPYRNREVRPIAYHLSKNFPQDLRSNIQHVESEWNRAFTRTIASLRENECTAAGGEPGSCATEHAPENVPQAFVVCDNPVGPEDHPACGEPGMVAEIGDLRYSLIGWVNEPHSFSPLGYGPSAADPETGEIVMGNAFVYGAAVQTLSTFARDVVAVLSGDVEQTDITAGALVDAWVERQQAPSSALTGRPADDHAARVDGFNVQRVAAAMDFSWARNSSGDTTSAPGAPPSTPAELLARFEQGRRELTRSGAFGRGDGRGRARLRNLLGTDIEQMMTSPELRMMAGVDPDLPVTEQVFDASSPLRGMSPTNLEALARARERVLSHGSGCILTAEFGDDGMLGLARAIARAIESGDGTMEWYSRTYSLARDDGRLDYEAVRAMLRQPIFNGVMAHELGHTLGLRHNFSGSYDSLNYHPRYWELRADGEVAPRAWDPLSQREIDGRIREYEYSTVMDYGNNFVVADAAGIGHYDEAAIKMGYGDLVEVFTNATDPGAMNWVHFIQDAGWPVTLTLSSFTGGSLAAHPYTEVPSVLGGIDRLEQRDDVPYESLQPDPFLAQNEIDVPLQDPQGRPAVPYRFCSDEQADLGPDCLRYDAGADPYEALQSVMDQYWNYYIFDAFRRGRLGFSTASYAQRVLGRYFVKLKYANQVYALYRGILEEVFDGAPGIDSFWSRQDGMGAFTAGVGAAFGMLTRIVTAPEPGSYRRVVRGTGTEALVPGGGGFFGSDATVAPFDGRYLETTWNFDDGYYWFDQVERAGYFYDKALALMVLTDPQTNFLGRDTSADVRRYQINFYSTFGPSMTGFFRGLLGEDWETIAPRIERDGNLRYPDALDLASGSMGGTPLDPNASFSIQLYAAVFGMALIPETYDQGYMNRARIWVRGGAEGVDIDPSVPIVEFTDPASGLTYTAASYPDPAGRETGPGAQMLLHAQTLAENGAQAELTRYLDNIDLVRRLSWLLPFGG